MNTLLIALDIIMITGIVVLVVAGAILGTWMQVQESQVHEHEKANR